ncbi:MIT domain-containing protein 1, partial [Aphelenchoides avenae]
EQLKELLRVFARLAPNLKRVNLVANRAKNSDLLAVQAWFEQSYGIILQFRFDKSIHDRWLRLNNGYNVSMGRGLDIYYPPSSVPWEQRKCRGCTFSFMPTKKLEILGACYAPLNTNTD